MDILVREYGSTTTSILSFTKKGYKEEGAIYLEDKMLLSTRVLAL